MKRKTQRLYVQSDVKGRIVSRAEVLVLLQQDVWFKLAYIRDELQEMYPGEFSVDEVARRANISKQSVRDAEGSRRGKGGLKITPRRDTLEKLAKVYPIPMRLLDDDCTLEEVGGFYLGKQEDKDRYFDEFYLTYRKQHIYDDREVLINPQDKALGYTYKSQCGPFDQGEDVIRQSDGGFTLDRYSVALTVSVSQVSSGHVLWEKRIGDDSVMFPEDTNILEQLISSELAFLSERFRKAHYEEGTPNEEQALRKAYMDNLRVSQLLANHQAYEQAMNEIEVSRQSSDGIPLHQNPILRNRPSLKLKDLND
ncbi:helix-turn-helix domain-containing protein [Paenibacillus chungangensis]|uniref:Helix-turn-helix domain-containing protein n=1 Tax=Paenibacillus chungangensis TaxID=696535 RepID=A0ABW3HKE3_9BACL